ncbi:hypothetical protein CHI14_03090 [Paenibacillus sp. 7516]|nr:hypothetical protein CHI14_03090 [Paenibacillus sp. 7516]
MQLSFLSGVCTLYIAFRWVDTECKNDKNSRFSKHVLHQMEIKPDKAIRLILTKQLFLVRFVTNKTRITKDNWLLDDKKITPVY